MKQFHVYIATNHSGTLYTGMTNNLQRRMLEHKQKQNQGFTSRYNIDKLVFYEPAANPNSAIAREKQIKGWVRRKKIALIESSNPLWVDLSQSWYEEDGN